VGVDTTGSQPAAGSANRLYIHTTAGSKLYLPEIDDGGTWQPWRANFSYQIITVHQVAYNWTVDPGGLGTYQPFGGANQMNLHNLDFTRFREARLMSRCSNSALSSAAITIKVVDVTNTQNITPINSFPATGAWITRVSAWQALNSATYAGDAVFELEGAANAAADLINVGTVVLELR
jgi:hypothetical protein